MAGEVSALKRVTEIGMDVSMSGNYEFSDLSKVGKYRFINVLRSMKFHILWNGKCRRILRQLKR
jgi:hypothetical protein